MRALKKAQNKNILPGKDSDIITTTTTIIINGDVVLAQSLLKQPQRSCHDTQKSYTQKIGLTVYLIVIHSEDIDSTLFASTALGKHVRGHATLHFDISRFD